MIVVSSKRVQNQAPRGSRLSLVPRQLSQRPRPEASQAEVFEEHLGQRILVPARDARAQIFIQFNYI